MAAALPDNELEEVPNYFLHFLLTHASSSSPQLFCVCFTTVETEPSKSANRQRKEFRIGKTFPPFENQSRSLYPTFKTIDFSIPWERRTWNMRRGSGTDSMVKKIFVPSSGDFLSNLWKNDNEKNLQVDDGAWTTLCRCRNRHPKN